MESFLISIAGNIAAGKSTLTKALETRTGGKIVSFLEQVDYVKKHGYLEKYYKAVSAYDRLKGTKLNGNDAGEFLKVKKEAEYWGYKIQETPRTQMHTSTSPTRTTESTRTFSSWLCITNPIRT
jgi:uridine kinase